MRPFVCVENRTDTAALRENDTAASPAGGAQKKDSARETGAAIARIGEDGDDGRVKLAIVGRRSIEG